MGEYLVEGAKLMCVNGSAIGLLKVPAGHGYSVGGKKKANCLDCKPVVNIPCFGTCRKNEKDHCCEGFIQLESKWLETAGGTTAPEKVGGENAISMTSALICKKGGLILPLTSGQGYDAGVDMEAFLARYANILRWVAGKNLSCHIFGKDPINLNTGNFIYEREELLIKGLQPLSFHLFYNVMDKRDGGSTGEGWRHNFDISIRKEPEQRMITVCLGDGREIPYRPALGDLYTPVFGDRGLLQKEGRGFRYLAGNDLEYRFDSEGRLLTRTDRDGSRDLFTHDRDGRLEKVTGANGGELTYTYNQAGRLISVTDHTGREVNLLYRYGKLWKLTTPAGAVYTYEYNVNNKLASVITPRGTEGLKNEYDGANRVLKQTTPDGGVVEFRYDDLNNRTYMKEQNGIMVIYESDSRFRNVRTIYKDGEEVFEYNDANQRTLAVDKNGNKTRYRYDAQGNLKGITDALGHETAYTYDGKGNLLTVTTDGRLTLENGYDKQGRLIKRSDALKRTLEISYDDNGRPARIRMPDDSLVRMEYDSRGNLTKLINPYEAAVTYTYDQLNRVISTADGQGNTTGYEIDVNDKLLSVTDPEGNRRSYAYDSSGNMVKIRDFNGLETTAVYNAMNKIERVTDSRGREIINAYDRMGNLAQEISPTGTVTSYRYDRCNRLTEIAVSTSEADDPVAVLRYNHDPVGNLVAVLAGDGEKNLSETGYEYDALNRITAVIDAVGGRTAYTYGRGRQIKSITDPQGNVRTFSYNKAGELAKETDIYGNTVSYRYNALGKPERVADESGRAVRHYYAPGGRLMKTIGADGREISYEYDELGRLAARDDGRGLRLAYRYDTLGRPVKIVTSSGAEISYTYDVMGNITSVTDFNGHTIRYEHTLSGEVAAAVDPLGNRTEYSYDAAGRLIHIRQQGTAGEAARETDYQRNSLGWLESIQDALGGLEYFTYDALGKVIEKTDREGFRTAFDYTPDGKPERILYGDGTRAELEYTPLRQLARIRDWLGETRIDWDGKSRPVKVTDHAGQAVSYEWGRYGERKGIIYPDGKKVGYQYDDLLRLEGMTVHRPGEEDIRAAYHYGTDGRLREKKISQGFKTTWKYDNMGRITELVNQDKATTLDHFTYAYDAAGNKTAVGRNRRGLPGERGDFRYHYDALNRLIGVEREGKPLRDYQYDPFGNRTAMADYSRGTRHTYTYDTLNRLSLEEEWQGERGEAVKSAATGYTYDRRGNLTGVYDGGQLRHSYTYNAMNRLAAAADGSREVSYRYNALGQRTGRDGEEYLLDLTKPYHNLLGIRSGEKAQDFYWDFGIAVMEDQEHWPRIYLNDELGSPLRLLYTTGKCDTYGYDEFGNEPEPGQGGKSLADISYTKQGEVQPFGFTGYRLDEISGTYFAQAREYQPQLGRFMAEDVFRGDSMLPKSLNRYGYCWDNPLAMVDLDGLLPQWLQNIADALGEIPKWADGICAHLQMSMEFKLLYGIGERYDGNPLSIVGKDEDDKPTTYGETNVFIPGGGTYGINGFADMVLHDNGTAYIYEIKPLSWYRDADKRDKGVKQLEKYIKYYELMEGNKEADKGKSEYLIALLNMETTFIFGTNQTIKYEMFGNDGMIYYEIKEGAEKDPQMKPIVDAMLKIQEEEKEKVAAIMDAIKAGAAVTASVVALIIAAALVLDDATIVGVADDPIAIALIMKATEWLGKAAQICAK